ncbi:XrtA system polysaccharide chain length determinant [Corallincola spongiicola]|uniref:Chain length determinant family protein n=1 Tax=Corallincola spongiicola TaxID=2520508 RepID=A0ABY1WQ22_9GAMM|nr:XrtA system polysaccharide chain length determinant [Corallincola spongiicola]TAA46809.1 chain length determinant family protein [Corallincola spongiicola]
MQDALELIQEKLFAVWQRKLFALLLVWPICIGGWIYVSNMPDVYDARARIYVDTETVLKPLLEGLTVEADVDTQVRLMFKNILSRSNLEKVARLSDMDLLANDEDQFDALIAQLQRDIKTIKLDKKQNLYTLIYQNQDPRMAKAVVESTINVFMEDILGETRIESQQAQQFLDKQLAEYERRLVEEDRKLADFKRQNSGLLPGESGGYYNRLEAEKRELQDATLALRQKESQLANAKQTLRDYETQMRAGSGAGQAFTSKYDQRIESLQQRLDDLSLRYTEQHPDIIETTRLLEQLERQRTEELQNSAMVPSAQSSGDMGYYQQLQLLVTTLESEAVSMRIQVSTYDARVKDLEQLVYKVPEVEANLLALRRGYEITRQKYEELLSRKETAALGQRAGEQADALKFRVIDQAKVSPKPVGPKRPVLYTMVLAAGFLIAIGVPIVLGELNPRVYSASSIVELTGIPLLGQVSDLDPSTQSLSGRLQAAGVGLSAVILLFIYGAIMFTQIASQSPVASRLKQMAEGVL